MGARVFFNDPHIRQGPPKRDFSGFEGMTSVAVGQRFDLFVLLTAHTGYRSIDFAGQVVPIVVTRNIVSKQRAGLFRK